MNRLYQHSAYRYRAIHIIKQMNLLVSFIDDEKDPSHRVSADRLAKRYSDLILEGDWGKILALGGMAKDIDKKSYDWYLTQMAVGFAEDTRRMESGVKTDGCKKD
jgi:hypothetical protein